MPPPGIARVNVARCVILASFSVSFWPEAPFCSEKASWFDLCSQSFSNRLNRSPYPFHLRTSFYETR